MNPTRVLTVILIPSLLVAAVDLLFGAFVGKPAVLAAAVTLAGAVVAGVVPADMDPEPWWYVPVVDGTVLLWAAAMGVALIWAVSS